MERAVIHILLHFAVPAYIAKQFFKSNWLYAWIIMSATLLVDLDHLLANPIYDPNRCSIGFHPLHSYWLIPVYLLMSVLPATRLVGIGLSIHMLLDGIDCFWMKAVL